MNINDLFLYWSHCCNDKLWDILNYIKYINISSSCLTASMRLSGNFYFRIQLTLCFRSTVMLSTKRIPGAPDWLRRQGAQLSISGLGVPAPCWVWRLLANKIRKTKKQTRIPVSVVAEAILINRNTSPCETFTGEPFTEVRKSRLKDMFGIWGGKMGNRKEIKELSKPAGSFRVVLKLYFTEAALPVVSECKQMQGIL